MRALPLTPYGSGLIFPKLLMGSPVPAESRTGRRSGRLRPAFRLLNSPTHTNDDNNVEHRSHARNARLAGAPYADVGPDARVRRCPSDSRAKSRRDPRRGRSALSRAASSRATWM